MRDGRWGKVGGMVEEEGWRDKRDIKKQLDRQKETEGGRMRISMTWSHSPEGKETNKNRKHGLDRLH